MLLRRFGGDVKWGGGRGGCEVACPALRRLPARREDSSTPILRYRLQRDPCKPDSGSGQGQSLCTPMRGMVRHVRGLWRGHLRLRRMRVLFRGARVGDRGSASLDAPTMVTVAGREDLEASLDTGLCLRSLLAGNAPLILVGAKST